MRFFTVPLCDQGQSESELNAFLSSHRVLSVERQFVAAGADSLWAICVQYFIAGAAQTPDPKGRVDYREILSEADFAIYAKLRNKRKEMATTEGVPPYAIFTNEQMADLVRRRVDSITAMRSVKGVGEARVQKYGEPFLAILREEVPCGGELAAANGDE